MKSIIITALIEGYRRAGVAHSIKPVTHPADAFSETQIEILEADPRISVAFSDVDAETTLADDPPSANEWAAVGRAIRELGPDDYTNGGKPEVDAINDALGEDAKRVSAKDRDRIWADMVEAGFSAPTKDAT